MEQNINLKLQIPRRYFCIAARFMKELGLYAYWIKYLYNPNSHKNWYEKGKCYTPVDVFGCTLITDFLVEHKKTFPEGYCVFEVFARYLIEMHPELDGTFSRKNACPRDLLDINKESKKIKLNYSYV